MIFALKHMVSLPFMRREYTAAQKAAWNRRYYEKKRQLGWVTCSFQAPVSVSKKLQLLKRELMEEYKKAHAGKARKG